MASLNATGKPFKLALIQLSVGLNKSKNLSRAAKKIEEAAKNGAQVCWRMSYYNGTGLYFRGAHYFITNNINYFDK